jgi:hypothetical protein
MNWEALAKFIEVHSWVLLFTKTTYKIQRVYLTPAGALVDVWTVGDKVFAVNILSSVCEVTVLKTG